MPQLVPRQPVPPVDLPLAGGGRWRLNDPAPEAFTLIVFYRGLHCPICRTQLQDVAAHLAGFADAGVRVVAASTDDAARAERAKAEWGLERLDIAHGLAVDDARRWGLYISTHRGKTSVGVDEPARFNEPGLFFVRPDGALYAAYTQSAPFMRPSAEDVLRMIARVAEKDYPARGEA